MTVNLVPLERKHQIDRELLEVIDEIKSRIESGETVGLIWLEAGGLDYENSAGFWINDGTNLIELLGELKILDADLTEICRE